MVASAKLERELAESRRNADDWMQKYGSTQGHSAPSSKAPMEDYIGRPRLPERVRDAIYWLNAGGRGLVADALATWAEDKILAYEGLEGVKDGAFSELEDRDGKLDAIAKALDMPKDSWRIAGCDVMAHQIRGLVAAYIKLQDREIEIASAPSSIEPSDNIATAERIQKEVAGALKSCVDAHGNIVQGSWIGSAAKRIAALLKTDFDTMADLLAKETERRVIAETSPSASAASSIGDTVPRSRYDACNRDWLEEKMKRENLTAKYIAELSAIQQGLEACLLASQHFEGDAMGALEEIEHRVRGLLKEIGEATEPKP
ncbi:MAG: hypothetical protein Q8P46_17770 [Hyphomicrobiales bacterium]|nr:hypothetical protein [Hyphomicrobiales bacterium]